jgi:hypothetical protein
VYGGKSITPASWTKARDELRPISSLPLLAMNHFPTTPIEVYILLDTFRAFNKKENIKQHDFQKVRPGLVPSLVNVDFYDVVGCVWAVKHCKSKLTSYLRRCDQCFIL